ncbi:hypothetical protein [Nostoc sp.]|uniref:hypothetical protein n=1 Tax=Nostoc sp. TaxID=1180 RepID=UPI002FFBFCD7
MFIQKVQTFVQKVQTFVQKVQTFVQKVQTFVQKAQTFVQKVQTFVQKVQTFVQKAQTFIQEHNLLDTRVLYPIGDNHSQQKISLCLVPHTPCPIPSPLYLRSQTYLT